MGSKRKLKSSDNDRPSAPAVPNVPITPSIPVDGPSTLPVVLPQPQTVRPQRPAPGTLHPQGPTQLPTWRPVKPGNVASDTIKTIIIAGVKHYERRAEVTIPALRGILAFTISWDTELKHPKYDVVCAIESITDIMERLAIKQVKTYFQRAGKKVMCFEVWITNEKPVAFSKELAVTVVFLTLDLPLLNMEDR